MDIAIGVIGIVLGLVLGWLVVNLFQKWQSSRQQHTPQGRESKEKAAFDRLTSLGNWAVYSAMVIATTVKRETLHKKVLGFKRTRVYSCTRVGNSKAVIPMGGLKIKPSSDSGVDWVIHLEAPKYPEPSFRVGKGLPRISQGTPLLQVTPDFKKRTQNQAESEARATLLGALRGKESETKETVQGYIRQMVQCVTGKTPSVRFVWKESD